ncbi:uncharacterized protein LOC131843527 [Achroia grisella]|uniref:uncharacterized protein LOC131843527 n=1 Tax=Achroia grisella TaxID=688607 RepID=UPI0027D252A5|nr:uncharacterized protein LOC131843527 [Achroia grisella]
MTAYLFNVMIIWIFIYIIGVYSAGTSGRSGPYKSTLITARRCVKTKVPYEKERTAIANLELYNTSTAVNLMRGNFTVFKETKHLKGTAKHYQWVNKKWTPSLVLRQDGCGGIFVTILVSAIGVKYDSKNCVVSVGNYFFKDLDSNKVAHMWLPTKEYGRALWKVEAFSTDGLVDCWDFTEIVEPI